MTPDHNSRPLPKITLLMGVLNGASFLQEQLNSVAEQTHSNWTLNCSDDGSTDHSTQLISDFARGSKMPIHFTFGPQTGFSDNYMGLIRALPKDPGYVAFADQDDVWDANKLAIALTALADAGTQPALYCGRRWVWYPQTDQQIASPPNARPFDFKNALIENVASGNTILLNPAAARLARFAAQNTAHVFAHDWWLYLLITGTGGRIIFDNDTPRIHYRQHAHNAVGAGRGATNHARRKVSVLRGAFADRLDNNIAAMNVAYDLLTPQAQATLDDFATARSARLFNRLGALYQIAPYRQNKLSTLGFWGAASAGLI